MSTSSDQPKPSTPLSRRVQQVLTAAVKLEELRPDIEKALALSEQVLAESSITGKQRTSK